MSMTVRDGEMVFHWCGESAGPFQYLQVSYATYDPDRRDFTAVKASGEYTLSPGEEFSVTSLPDAATSTTSPDLPVTDISTTVFVYTGSSPQELDGFFVILRTNDPSQLEGKWVYPNGTVHSEPCDMKGAATDRP
jgi:hypothetical protein